MSSHRKPRSGAGPLARRAVRAGLFAAGMAGAAAAVPAQAATAMPHSAVASDHVFSHADHHDHTEVRDSFTVRQLGTVDAATARNQAQAVSAGCSADDHCRSVALSFQIVTMAGDSTHLNAINLSDAVNKECTGCQTLAGAYQFVVSTPKPFLLGKDASHRLDGIHRRLDALSRSRLPAADLRTRVDALAAEVTGVLDDAVAHAPAAAPRSGGGRPGVTLHRRLDGWPGR
ncbi:MULTISPECIES: hypothetical protein [Streptomyces]|uniref:Uncharacterized protein n=1 Tax=Streptomyces doudnae TaxID=3075536 RepID=A0ABD5ET65_9ACTN|nr:MULTISPECIES: hypothetical protein [unclassified Streptomyces]MDT0437906.1 hypothetical protein [Streptomyces sp. DSM 41981]MYQ66950.1 hypothetical protein [Streptomyces sp. SID4950]SCE27816.1 hypothetical protein GA0115242_128029 [Streptomyces sp. SolWspMP-5a-2]